MTLRLLPIHTTLFYISNHQRAAFYSPFDHQSHKRTVPFKWYHLNNFWVAVWSAYNCHEINWVLSFILGWIPTSYLQQQKEQAAAAAVQIACLLCRQPFPSDTELRQHMSVHADTNEYKCDTCNQSLSSKATLGRFIRGIVCATILCMLCVIIFAKECIILHVLKYLVEFLTWALYLHC